MTVITTLEGVTDEVVDQLLLDAEENLQNFGRMICFSPKPVTLSKNFEWMESKHDWPASHARIELFRIAFEPGERVLFLAPGAEVVGKLGEMLSAEPRPLTMAGEMDVMFWTADALFDVYRSFARRPRFEIPAVTLIRQLAGRFDQFPVGSVEWCEGDPSPAARVVFRRAS